MKEVARVHVTDKAKEIIAIFPIASINVFTLKSL